MGRMKEYHYDILIAEDIEYNERNFKTKEEDMEEYFAEMEAKWLESQELEEKKKGA